MNILQLENRHDVDKVEIELLRADKWASDLEKKNQMILVGFLAAGLLLLIVLFLSKRATGIKKALEAELVNSEYRTKELQTEKLIKELKNKNADLTNLGLDIARKKEFSKNLISKLEAFNIEDNSADVSQEISELIKMTAENYILKEDIEMLQKSDTNINEEFYQKLGNLYPNLTANDKVLAGLIRLKLSNKDIASIKNISSSSAKMARYRLRKKMHLDRNEDVAIFLEKL